MKANKKVKLFATCIPVRGAERSLICDLQRQTFDFIPNDLYDVLILHNGKTLYDIKKEYDNQYDDIIQEYFDFLIEKEYVFFTDNTEWYPEMSLQWHEPFLVNNAIIDFDINTLEFKKTLSQLDKLKCKSVEFRFFSTTKLELINDILLFLEQEKSIVYSIGFILPYSEETTIEKLQAIISNNPRLSYFTVTNSPKNNFITSSQERNSYIYYSKEIINSASHCGIINSRNFVVNTRLFTESQSHNTCLNRKISIDKDGNIKNCPSMVESFGNIKNTTLEEALSNPNFKKYWNINKDEIEICKDCEFRHICTDCRAFTEEPGNMYSKPLKCGYNPYTNVWEEWSVNPLKQKAIEHYDLRLKINLM